MKKWTLTFTQEDSGEIRIASSNQGFNNTLELIALLEMKKGDLLALISPDTYFKRIFIDDEDGTTSEIEEVKPDENR